MLTKRQLEAFEFIDAEITRTGGKSPSFDEIKDHLRLKSKSGVFRLMRALEDRGFIRREKRVRRAITILRRPDKNLLKTYAPFAVIPDNPASIFSEVEALHLLIDARLTVLDNMIDDWTVDSADATSDFSKRGTSACTAGIDEHAVV